jgi:hypothetical protein
VASSDPLAVGVELTRQTAPVHLPPRVRETRSTTTHFASLAVAIVA